ncbi:MAG: DUF861 domain-containing protein [Candidatus Leucobacter sulfamidivorax]|nr:DUF861 domain-containing protein [Candidatus Leucobacter sulfamidivorax]
MSNILTPRHLKVGETALEPREKLSPENGEISALPVWKMGGITHGIWQMAPGTLTNFPGPETITLISGRATVTVDQTGETVELTPGDLFVIDEGETATWVVHETVRKVYAIHRDS